MTIPDWAMWFLGAVLTVMVSAIGYMIRRTLESIDRRLEQITEQLGRLGGEVAGCVTHGQCDSRRAECIRRHGPDMSPGSY